MRIPSSLLLFLLVNALAAQDLSVSIVYENPDAFNGLKQRPENALYLSNISGLKFIEGKQRSSLRLHDHTGVYTIDSLNISSLGNKAKAWRYSVVNIRDYTTSSRFSIYPNLARGFAYFENCTADIVWNVDRTKTKNILGLKCYYASAEIGKSFHQIWFTNELPYNDGPFLSEKEHGCDLPGLVLEHTMGNDFTTTAVDIDFIDPDPSLTGRVKQLKAYESASKPTYSPGQAASEGMIILTEDTTTESWIPLKYESSVIEDWFAKKK